MLSSEKMNLDNPEDEGGFTLFCTKCGHQNPEGSQYCNNCGELLLAGNLGEKKYKIHTARRRRQRTSSKLPLIFAGLLVVFCALVVLIYFIVVSPSSPPSTKIISLEIEPSTKQMAIDATQAFTVYGITSENQKERLSDVTWAIRPAELGEMDENGVFHPSIAGEGTLEASSGEMRAAATVKVLPGASIVKIDLIPASVNLVLNEQQQFIVKAIDRSGSEVTINPKWSMLDGKVGTIDEKGMFTALSTGNATIIASYRYNSTEVSDSAVAIIREGQPSSVRRLEISPPSIDLKTGEIYQFIAKGFDREDKEVQVTPTWQVVGDAGTIDEKGNFSATQEGQATVEAIYNGITATAEVTVSTEGLSFAKFALSDQAFSLEYPSNWDLAEGDKLVKFISPTQTDTLFSYTAIAGCEELAEGKDLASYATENKGWALKKFPDAAFSEEDRVFGEVNGKIIPFTTSLYRGFLGCAVSERSGFFFFAYSNEKEFSLFEATFRRMLASWQIPRVTSTSSPTPTESPRTFTSTAYRFSFTYPEAWQESQLPGVTAYITGEVVKNYLPNMTVKVEELTRSMSARELAEKIEKERLINYYQDYKSLSLEDISLGNSPATKRIFAITFQGQPLKEVQYYVVHGNLGFLITFDVSEEAYMDVSAIFEQIAATFTFH